MFQWGLVLTDNIIEFFLFMTGILSLHHSIASKSFKLDTNLNVMTFVQDNVLFKMLQGWHIT